MIGVATQIEAPIKLTFADSNGGSRSLIGLGDIALPGIFICFALRFDLHMYWLARTKIETRAVQCSTVDDISAKLIDEGPTKATYISATGLWGDRLIDQIWHGAYSMGIISQHLHLYSKTPVELDAVAFPKPYFWASIIGYSIGLALTTVILNIFHHGQPALLYLVPGVIIPTVLLALARGETKQYWAYSEKDATVADIRVSTKETQEKNSDKIESKSVSGTVPGTGNRCFCLEFAGPICDDVTIDEIREKHPLKASITDPKPIIDSTKSSLKLEPASQPTKAFSVWENNIKNPASSPSSSSSTAASTDASTSSIPSDRLSDIVPLSDLGEDMA